MSVAKAREGIAPPERKPYKASGYSNAPQQFAQQTSMAQVPDGGIADDDDLPF